MFFIIFNVISNTSFPLYHALKQMAGVAVEGGGISGGTNGVEGRWGEGLGLANEVGSGVVAVSLSLPLDIVSPILSS